MSDGGEHAAAKISLLRAREAELHRLMEALSPPRTKKASPLPSSHSSTTIPPVNVVVVDSTTSTTTTATTPNPSTTPPPSQRTRHSRGSARDDRSHVSPAPSAGRRPNGGKGVTTHQHRARPSVQNEQTEKNERQVRQAFGRSKKKNHEDRRPIHHTKPTPIRFERAHERILQGHRETTMVLPSHPVLQLHREIHSLPGIQVLHYCPVHCTVPGPAQPRSGIGPHLNFI